MLHRGLLTALTLASITAFASSANAEPSTDYKNEMVAPVPCVQPLMLKDGFYLGGSVGYDMNHVSSDVSVTVLGAPFATTQSTSARGWNGGVFGGYGAYFYNTMYLGAEIFGNVSDAHATSSVTIPGLALTSKFSQRGNWGVSVLPGYKVNDSSLVYARLGWSQAKFSAEVSAPAVIGEENGFRSGFNYGVGIETAVYQNVSVRAEYNHTTYGSFDIYKPSDNQFTFGVLYHFA